MALSRLVASLLLLSLLAVASANSSYGYYQKPNNVDESPNGEHKETGNLVGHVYKQVENLIHPTQPGSSDVHNEEYGYQSEQGNENSQEDVKPTMPEGHENFIPAESTYGQKPKTDNHDYQSHDGVNYIVIQGFILCKSGVSMVKEIPGAIAKIICPGGNVNGYEYAPFTISSEANEHGYYCAKYPVSNLPKSDWTQLVKGCQVIPEYSPLGICNFSFLNTGSKGAYVSYSRITGDKAYYNAGNVFFTPASSYDYPKQSTIPEETELPSGGGY